MQFTQRAPSPFCHQTYLPRIIRQVQYALQRTCLSLSLGPTACRFRHRRGFFDALDLDSGCLAIIISKLAHPLSTHNLTFGAFLAPKKESRLSLRILTLAPTVAGRLRVSPAELGHSGTLTMIYIWLRGTVHP